MQQLFKYSPVLTFFVSLMILTASYLRIWLAPYPSECVSGTFVWYKSAIAFVLLCITGVVVNRTLSYMRILSVGNCQTLLLFIVASCGIYVSPSLLPSFSALSIALFISYALKSIKVKEGHGNLFLSFFFLGLATAIMPKLAWTILLFFVYILYVRLSFKEIVSAIVAFFLPSALWIYIKWYTSASFEDVVLYYINAPFQFFTLFEYCVPLSFAIVIMTVLAALGLWSVIVAVPSMQTILIRRRMISFLIWAFFILLLTALLVNCSIDVIPCVAVPLSILASVSLERMDTRFSNIVFDSLIICMILHYWIE